MRRFTAILSEAHLLAGQTERALELATAALESTASTKWLIAIAYAERAMGRVESASGNLVDAEASLNRALGIFASIQSHFQAGRTRLLLAETAHKRGAPERSRALLSEAHQAFTALGIPSAAARAESLARTLGVSATI